MAKKNQELTLLEQNQFLNQKLEKKKKKKKNLS
jgi:hypothetical protein